MSTYDQSITSTRKWTVFVIMSIGSFMFLLSASSINVALPVVESEFDASLSGIQWVVTAYLLMISSVLPIFGWAGDMLKRSYVIALGFAVFALGAIFCAWSTTLEGLITARIVQGIGASMNMANSYAAITTVFPEDQRGRALGMMGSTVALGSISGPAVGGFLLEWFSWHSIFYITVPFAIVGCILACIYIPDGAKKAKYKKFDVLGSLLLVGAMSACIVTLSQWGRDGWSNLTIAALGLTSIVLFLVLYLWEKRISYPLIELDLFKNKVFLNGNLSGFCAFLTLNVSAILLPFYLHNVFDATPRLMGMVMMVFPIMVIISAPISGALSDRYGASKFSIAGISLMSLSMFTLALTAQLKLLWLFVTVLVFYGIGNGLFQSPNNSTTLSVVKTEKHGMAGSIIALMRNFGAVVGAVLGVRVCDLVIEGKEVAGVVPTEVFIQGYRVSILMGAFVALLGLYFSLSKQKNLASFSKGESNART